MSIKIQCPAKVNLFLEILARRPDGYHEIATLMAPMSYFQTSATGVTIDRPQAMSIVVFPRRQTWRCNVAEKDIRRIVKELKGQRRQIDRAIVALEAIVNGTQRQPRTGVTIKRPTQDLRAEMENGTTGRVVPFVRHLRSSG